MGRHRLNNRVTRELGVSLPFDGEAIATQTQKIAVQLVQAQVGMPGQKFQVRPLLLAANALVQHGHINHQSGHAHARRGPGMHFVVKLAPLFVVQGQVTGIHFIHRRIVNEKP